MIDGLLNGSEAPDKAQFERAVRWCRAEFNKRWDGWEHPSHLADKLLEEADKKFELRSYGVEGQSNSTGRSGFSYLNYGDPYIPTIVARTSPTKVSFHYASGWASYAGR